LGYKTILVYGDYAIEAYLRLMNIHQPTYYEGKLYACCTGGPQKALLGTLEYNYQPWKIHVLIGDDWVPVATGAAKNSIECNPSFYRSEDGVRMSFVNSVVLPHEPLHYRLYSMSLDTENPSIHKIETERFFTACLTNNYTVTVAKEFLRYRKNGSKQIMQRECVCDEILRVVCVDLSDKLIITVRIDNCFRSFYFDLSEGIEGREILCDGKPVYKCTVVDDVVWHAVRDGDARRLQFGPYSEGDFLNVTGVAETIYVPEPEPGLVYRADLNDDEFERWPVTRRNGYAVRCHPGDLVVPRNHRKQKTKVRLKSDGSVQVNRRPCLSCGKARRK